MVKTKRVVIVGIPGVGKTTVVTEVFNQLQQKNLKIENLTFGTIMFEEAQKLGISNRDEMRKLSVDEQKNLQIKSAQTIAQINADVVLIDTHLFIKTNSGYLPGLPKDILDYLLPTNLVLVEAKPQDILNRRANDPTRTRDSATINSIELDNQIARSMLSSSGVLTGASVFITINQEGKSEEAAKSIADFII